MVGYRRRSIVTIAWLGLVLWIAFFNGLGNTGLLDETEPMFVEAARQMWETGDWLTPYFNGAIRFDKPPLVYWLMGGFFRWFGPTVWAARLAAAVPGTIVVLVTFWGLDWVRQNLLVSRMARSVPYLGAAVVGLNLQTFFFGRLGYSDMLLNACMAGSLWAFFLGYCQPETPLRQRLWYLLWFVLMGFGVLTKGPVAVVLPGLIVSLFLLLTRNLGQVLRYELPWRTGLLLLSLIALPWYGLMYQAHGAAFIDAFFGFHNVQRFTEVVNQHGGAWYYHFAILLPGLLPWSIALPAAIWRVLKRPIVPRDRPSHLGVFAFIWFAVVMTFFTIAATKYLTYSLPALPAAALLITLWWNEVMQQKSATWDLRLTNYGTLAIFVALAIASVYAPNWLNNDDSMPMLGRELAAAGLPVVGGILWAVSALLGLLYLRQSGFWRVNLIAAASFVMFFVTPTFWVIDQVRQKPLRGIATALAEAQQPGEPLAMGTQFFGKPSVVFYSQRSVALMRRSSELLNYLAMQQAKPEVQSVLLITTAATLEEAVIDPSRYRLLNQVGIYQLVRVPVK
jgi:4-amino-4-deoxy-L-arabinose transferase-like glycosyltransferase